MPRLFALAAVLLITLPLAALAPASPVPKHVVKPVLYSPVQKGALWVYNCRVKDGNNHEREMALTGVKEGKDGEKLIPLADKTQGKDIPYSIQSVSEKGLSVVWWLGGNQDEPFRVLKWPHIDGQKWATVLSITDEGKLMG